MQTSCQSCTFFDEHHGNQNQVDEAGLCRYNPPIQQPEADVRGLWPVVKEDDWCGHHTEARQPH
ncbi:hypothetical protein [Jannaschia seosinensis]|nr:hypothetical protein [Jannaschia seosinensis]